MICQQCRRQILKGSSFCEFCGSAAPVNGQAYDQNYANMQANGQWQGNGNQNYPNSQQQADLDWNSNNMAGQPVQVAQPSESKNSVMIIVVSILATVVAVSIAMICFLYFRDDSNSVADPYSYNSASVNSSWTSAHITCSTTYLYYEASTDTKPPETRCLYQDDNIEYLGTVGNFYYARTDDGSGGYMYGYVQTKYVADGAGMYAWTYVVVNQDSANVCSLPSKNTDSNIIGTVYSGATFSVYSYDGYWFKIDYNGTVGYISHKMVTGG
ncbi:MAG: SH3 domain-containing protein [Ruminococcus sp.]|nr:SH3 domain-containing protein [Ruminococcus sp.]